MVNQLRVVKARTRGSNEVPFRRYGATDWRQSPPLVPSDTAEETSEALGTRATDTEPRARDFGAEREFRGRGGADVFPC